MSLAPTRPMELRSERLLYRPLRLEDWEDILRYRGNAVFVSIYGEEPYSPEQARAFVRRFVDWEAERPIRRFAFGVNLHDSESIVGVCSLRRETVDRPDAEVGFELAPELWGRGLGTEMGREMLRLGFGRFGLHRLQAHCVADNAGSQRVLEKLGMQLEGRLREKHGRKGRYRDELCYGILRHEWEPTRSGG